MILQRLCTIPLLALGIIMGLFIPTVHAQMNIEIKGVGQTLYPIAVARFKDEDKLPVKISDVIRQNLKRSGYFRNVELGNGVEDDQAVPNFKTWAARGPDALAVGSVTQKSPGQYEVSYRLYDIRKGESLNELIVSASEDNLRLAAHKISDDVIFKLLGERGVFSTRLSYVMEEDKRYRLVISDADGQNMRNALNSSEPIISVAWSPDPQKIAYVSFEDRKPIVYVHELATGRRIVLSNERGNNSAPSWAPDGKSLAISLSKDGNTQIYRVNADGSNLRRLTQGNTIDTEPQFSPDGRFIYFTSDRGGNPQIYRMSADGEHGEPARRITFKQPYATSARISPDSKYLAYIGGAGDGFKLFLMNLLTGDSIPMTDTSFDESPSFAANGRYILYSTQVGAKKVLAAVSVDGYVKQILSIPGSNVRQPSWGPFMDR